jgi:cellulose synthase/poly-beta-1,6-N-acetylglucosamine synthase-like glycosyltransferase
VALSAGGIAVTLLAAVFVYRDVVRLVLSGAQTPSVWLEQAVFATAVTLLLYGNLVYQLTRAGYFARLRRHRPVGPAALDRLFRGRGAPSLQVLVPSYKEEERVVRQTLLSAALQEYPRLRVTLLIDDPPAPEDAGSAQALTRARALPCEVEQALRVPLAGCRARYRAFRRRLRRRTANECAEALHLADACNAVADWFAAEARRHPVRDHTDALFVEMVLGEGEHAYRARARELLEGPGSRASSANVTSTSRTSPTRR